MNKTCYTALFGNYEELKEPTVVTPGWDYVCFTDQPLKSDVWKIRYTDVIGDPQRMARRMKILGWQEWQYSMWIDASFQINKDLNDWWAERFVSPFSCAKHPLRSDVYHEARTCIVNRRGDAEQIHNQITRYAELKVPSNNGIITSGILLRENTPENIELHDRWWDEVSRHSVRDQLAFAYVSQGVDFIHTYKWDYSQSKEFKYHKHYNQRQ